MRITFVGAGAVGGYFGLRMAEAGLDVSFLLRPQSARVLRSRGFRLRSPQGDFELSAPAVLDGSADVPPPDVLFFACKAEHVRAAAQLARPLAGSNTLAIPLQNGVDAPSMLRRVLGPERVLGGLSRIFAERSSPGRVVHMGLFPSIACGEYRTGRSDRVERIVRHIQGVGGMSVAGSDDIWTEMWTKLLMVCALGASGAVARAPLGTLLAVPEAHALLVTVAEEIAAVGRAHGAKVPMDFARVQIGRYKNLPPDTTASMHRDLERGEPSEVREQLGAARKYGREASVPTPVLDALYGALLPGELRARGQLAFESVPPRDA